MKAALELSKAECSVNGGEEAEVKEEGATGGANGSGDLLLDFNSSGERRGWREMGGRV